MRSSSTTHCLQSSLRKWYAWNLKNSFTKEQAQDHVLFSEQIRNVDYKIYPDKKKITFGNTKRCAELPGNRMQHCGLLSSRHVPHNSSTAEWTKTYSCQVDRDEHKEQFLKDMSQTQKINRFSEASQKLLQDDEQTEIFEFCEYFDEISMLRLQLL